MDGYIAIATFLSRNLGTNLLTAIFVIVFYWTNVIVIMNVPVMLLINKIIMCINQMNRT